MDWKRLGISLLAACSILGGIVGLLLLIEWLEKHDATWVLPMTFFVAVVTAIIYFSTG